MQVLWSIHPIKFNKNRIYCFVFLLLGTRREVLCCDSTTSKPNQPQPETVGANHIELPKFFYFVQYSLFSVKDYGSLLLQRNFQVNENRSEVLKWVKQSSRCSCWWPKSCQSFLWLIRRKVWNYHGKDLRLSLQTPPHRRLWCGQNLCSLQILWRCI